MQPDDIFRNAFKEVAAKLAIQKLDPEVVVQSIKFPSLSLRVLFQNDGLLLGKIIHLVGEEASFKSTLALEILSWHLDKNGYGVVLETEGRPIVDIYSNLIRSELLERLSVFPCSCLEEWQKILITYTQKFSEIKYKVPICFIIDSIMGANSAKTTEDIIKDGFASTRYAIEARSIADFLRSYSRFLYSNPFTVCIVNHRKYRMTGYPYSVPIKSSLGGNEIKFYSSFELDVSKEVGQKAFGNEIEYQIKLKTYKNTYGQENIELMAPIAFIRDNNQLKIKFGWSDATVRLLTEFDNIKPKLTETAKSKIKSICNIEFRRAGRFGKVYRCPDLGINEDVSADVIDVELEKRKDILSELYKIFNISERPEFNQKGDSDA